VLAKDHDTVQTAYQEGDTLVVGGKSFDPIAKDNKFYFTGVNTPVSAAWVDTGNHLLGVPIPVGALSGPVQVKIGGETLGLTSIQIVGRPIGVANALSSFFENLNSSFLAYLIALATLGTLTMAIVQALKGLFQLKSWFQRWYVRSWLREHKCLAKSHGMNV